MSFTQTITFDTNKGGHVPNLCLNNVCKGYGIPDKYGSAMEAWQHTEQHPDRDVPAGVAVPLYYSYTVDLGDGPQNYGHINVQLPDGRVWSDGNYYTNIDGYLANHAPKFLGWGESVNDFKVIEKEEIDMKPQRNQIILAYKLAFGPSHPPTEEQVTAQLDQPDLSHVLISIEGDSAKAWSAASSDAKVLPAGIYKVN